MKREKKSQHPKGEVEDAIAFLHSMMELVDARRWSRLTDYFARATLGLADEILGPKKEPEAKAIEDARQAIAAARTLLEEFPPQQHDRVPVPIWKGTITMIETAVRAAQEEYLAEVSHPSTAKQEGRP